MATGRIGTTPVLQVRWSKAPSDGTTSLSGLDDNSVSLVYSVGYEAVYRNGVLLSRGNDYTATDGTTVTLIDATITGDIIEIFANQTIPLSDTYSQTVSDGKFINNTLTTTTGDIIYASGANTPARLAIGTSADVLTVSGGIPAWAAPATGGETLISTTTLSGASTVLSPVPTGYNAIRILITGATNDTADGKLRINGESQNVSMSGVESTAAVGIINGYIESNSSYLRTSNSNGANLIIYNYTEDAVQRQPIYYSGHYIATGSINKAFIYGGSGGSGNGWESITILNTGGNWSAGTVKLFGVK
jgi:hypothetical protein